MNARTISLTVRLDGVGALSYSRSDASIRSFPGAIKDTVFNVFHLPTNSMKICYQDSFSVAFSLLRKPEPRLMFDNLLFFFFGK